MKTDSTMIQRSISILAVGVVLISVSSAQAQTDTTWLGGSGVWNDAANWSAGVPNGTFNVFVDDGNAAASEASFPFSLAVSVDSLTVDSDDRVVINNNSRMTIVTDIGRPDSGKIHNDGEIELDNAGASTRLDIASDVTLSGNGIITLGGVSETSRITDISGSDGHLTNESNTLQGYGRIGDNTLQVTNQAGGIIDANIAGQVLTIDAPASGNIINLGTMRATNGGILLFTTGIYENTGGTIEAQAGSAVSIADGANLTGGVLQTSGDGFFVVPNNETATLTDVTLAAGGTINQWNNSDFNLSGTINNLGEIVVNNVGNNTDVQIATPVMLIGGGTLKLEGSSNFSRVTDPSGGDGLLTNVDNVIAGRGSLGSNLLQIINESGGLIDANSTDGPLILDAPASAEMANMGTARGSQGGTLLITTGSYDNSGGTILAQPGSFVSVADAAIVSGGTLKTEGDGLLFVANNENATFSDLTIDSDSTLSQFNNSDMRFAGAINNEGSISVLNSGNLTDIQIDTTATLTGGGTIKLDGPTNNSRLSDPSLDDGVLTNVDNVIEGRGNVGANSLQIINQAAGIIDANSTAGPLTIDAPPTASMINSGTMRASDGGIMLITTGNYDNSNGVIEALDGSFVSIADGAFVSGGNLRSFGDGAVVVVNNEFATLSAITIETGSVFNQLNNSDVSIEQTITNQGNIVVTNNGNLTDLEIDVSATLEGAGTVTLEGTSDFSRLVDPSGDDGVLTNVDNKIEGRGNIGGDSLIFVNQASGIVDANSPVGTLLVDPIDTEPISNQGIMRASAGGTLRFSKGTVDNTGGTIEALASSTVLLGNDSAIVGGTLNTSDDGVVVVPNNLESNIDSVTNEGNLVVLNNSDLNVFGNIVNNGIISVESIGNTTNIQISDESVAVTGTGTLSLNTTTSRISATGVGDLTVVGNRLQGIGQILTETNLSSVELAPGNSIGSIQLGSAVSIDNNSQLEIEMDLANGFQGINWDLVNANGDLDLLQTGSSVLTVKLVTLANDGNPGPLADFDPTQDYVFTVAVANTISNFSPANMAVDLTEFSNSVTGEFSVTKGPFDGVERLVVKYGQFKIGDINQDGAINLLDVQPFIDAVGGGQYTSEADINCDGSVNLLDVNPFIELLAS